LLTIGSGTAGMANGKLHEACFNQPQGLCLHSHTLYVADTGNHAIRKVDLLTRTVTTLTGNGEMGRYFFDKAWGEPILPNSPWDLVIMPDNLYIANAGNHQLLKLPTATGEAFRFAGSGREALIDGVLKKGAFNQPSGLALAKGKLYVADAEASAIREVDLVNERINTLVGQGLFVFGDEDGPMAQARLQHCMDICVYEKHLLVADTYNGKIKLLDLENQTIHTILEGFHHPQGVCYDGQWIWVSDTYAHQLYRFNPKYPLAKPQKISIF
jgi:sugar lactone lactonase YvrE